MRHIQLRDRHLEPTFDNILKEKETQDLEYVQHFTSQIASGLFSSNGSGYYGQAITHITPIYSFASEYVPAASGVLVLNSNQQAWTMSGSWGSINVNNRWIATHESYWGINSNWSLGHVPLETENAIFSGNNIGKCNIYGDVHIHNFIVEEDCLVYIDIGDEVTVHANMLDIGSNSTVNFNVSNIICDGSINISPSAHVPTGNSNLTFTSQEIITTSAADWYNNIYGDKITSG